MFKKNLVHETPKDLNPGSKHFYVTRHLSGDPPNEPNSLLNTLIGHVIACPGHMNLRNAGAV